LRFGMVKLKNKKEAYIYMRKFRLLIIIAATEKSRGKTKKG
jgi:hypothetical protein